MFATQRIAFLFSFGMNRRTKAPTSGVNKMIERMWFYIEQFSALSSSSQLKAAPPKWRTRLC